MYVKYELVFIYIILSLEKITASITLRQKCESLSTDYKVYAYGSCFVMNHTHKGHWDTWPEKCNLFPNGRLATESNSAIMKIFQDFLTQSGDPHVWIGGYKVDPANKIVVWIMNREGDQKPMNQGIFFHSTEPNTLNTELCIVHSQNVGLWFDVPCTWDLVFACQYDDTISQYKMVATGKKGSNNTEIGTFITNNQEQCAIKCRLDPFCYSFSYKETDGECILSWDVATSTENPPEINNDYKLFNKY